MRFRCCCVCGDKENPETVKNLHKSGDQSELPPKTVIVPQVVTRQPKNVADLHPIQLDRVTEVSVEESSAVQAAEKEQTPVALDISTQEQSNTETSNQKEKEQTPFRLDISNQEQSNAELTQPTSNQKENEQTPVALDISNQEQSNSEPIQATPNQLPNTEEPSQEEITVVDIDGKKMLAKNAAQMIVLTEIRDKLLADKAARNQISPQPSNQGSNIEIITTIQGEKLILNQIAPVPDLYRGTFKGSLFYIFEGNIQDSSQVLNESDRAAIIHVYNEAMNAMQRGAKELAGGHSALKDQTAWNPPPGSAINTNYTTRRGENAVMTFKYIGPGHFTSTYEGKDFVILNGKLLVDESFDELDRSLIMQTYNNTLLGMQQGLMSMQQGMQNLKTSASAVKSGESNYEPVYNLGTGRETLRRNHSLNKKSKRIGLLQSGMMDQPQTTVVPVNNTKSRVPEDDEENDDDGLWEYSNQEQLFGPWTTVGFREAERKINPAYFFSK